ncbi:MAG TPA: right-handed parallel beta-helix repeat-containing protein [Verrucomicrobiae bacterium]|nr:right-handed parallel beta-helix repeat-containing protein [Verrucomicrobiae bacterium]
MKTKFMSGIRSWRAVTVVLAGLACLVPLSSAAITGTFYVAPNGKDDWSGTRPNPNVLRTDGPFATLNRAVKAARDWKGAGHTESGTSIHVASGAYEFEQPLVLTPADNGLNIIGPEKGEAIFSGGKRIAGWKKAQVEGKSLWAANLPDVRQGKWYFRELWVNGHRATRARHPNSGYLKVSGLPDPQKDWTRGQKRFQYQAGDLPAWATITNAEIIVMNRWTESRLPVLSVDAADNIVNLEKRSVFALEEGDLYYLEGALEALDQPGEWYLDRQQGFLYYLPRPGESIGNLEAFAPALSQVVKIEGGPERGQFVDGVVFRNLTFSHTEWCFPEGFAVAKDKPAIYPEPAPQVGGFGQAAIGVPASVLAKWARNCLFESCKFKDLGDYALELGRGCQSNRVARCEFSDLGAGGIKIGETGIRENFDLATANEIADCQVRDGGKMFHSAIGIWIGQSPGNRILRDEIHDFYYTGISIGWTWGYGPSGASNNLVAFNRVHHIGVKSDGDGPILSDMGGIYTLGKQAGTRIVNNLWHDIAGLRYGGWGIYFDEGSSGILAVSNVVYHTTHGGFHQHYGETNMVWNNVFAFARDHQLQRTRVEPHTSFLFQTNIVYFDKGVLLGGDWSKDQYEMDWNVFFDARPEAKPEDLRFGNATFEQWRERGHDIHSLVADPLFVSAAQFDFSLRPQSPALRLGFQPIDLGHTGCAVVNGAVK